MADYYPLIARAVAGLLIAHVLICVVALLHLYFLVLEMFLWRTPRGLRKLAPIA